MIADFREDARSDVPSEHALEALIAKRIVTRVCKRPGGKSASDSAIRPIVCLAGAFSKASTTSTACIASFESCDVHFGPDATETRMIVFQEERVSLNVELEANGARAVGDVDGDGLDDLLLTSGGSGQGITTVHMSLASLAGGKVTTLHEFSLGEELSCGGFTPTPHDEAPVFSMRAQGSVPIFREELYARECEENAPWVLAKTQSP